MDTVDSSEKTIDELKCMEYLKQNLDQVMHLRAFHQNQLENSENNIKLFEKYLSDYHALRIRLTTLPDKPRHEALIPFGSIAFMKGHIVHTNTILALLGDNWFAELSAKQAVAVVSRRIQVCQEKLSALKSAYEIHKNWVSETDKIINSGRGDVNIVEQVSEEEYQKLKHQKPLAPLSQSSEQTDEEILKRLEQLEMQEAERGELDSSYSNTSESEESSEESTMDEDDSQMSFQTDPESILFRRQKLQRRVSWADQLSDGKDESSSDTVVMKYSSEPTVCEESESQQVTPTEEAVATPEVYHIYRSNSLSKSSPPKSILKKTLSNPTVQETEHSDFTAWFQSLSDETAEVPVPKAPLSESAKEIKALKVAVSNEVVAMDDEPVEEEVPEERKMSRFKLARAKK